MDVSLLDVTKINEMIEQGFILPNRAINSNSFHNKYLNIINIEERRYYINNLKQNNYLLYDVINEKLLKKYDQIFDDGFSDYIKEYKKVMKMPNSEEILMKICSNEFFKMFIDRYFEDFSFNILINIKNMLDFNSKIDYKIIDKDRLKIYHSILNFSIYDLEKQKEIYNNTPKDIKTLLYEDFRKSQNYAYTLINNSIIDINALKHEDINDINVYYLNGEDFILPVHCLPFLRNDKSATWEDNNNVKTLSISLIGTECLGSYRDDNYDMVGFNKLNINHIKHMFHIDSYSNPEDGSDKINELYTPHDLLSNTYKYNEIIILNSDELKPSYVVCYNNVYDYDIEFSKRIGNIPIIVINREVYEKSTKYSKNDGHDFNDKRYIKLLPSFHQYL